MKRCVLLMGMLFILVLAGCGELPVSSESVATVSSNTEIFLEPDLGLVGKVNVSKKVSLSFPLQGLLDELLVKEGDRVLKGQELARLDTSDLDREILDAQAAVAVARANYELALAKPHPALIREAELQITAVASERVVGAAQETAQALEVEVVVQQLDYLHSLPLPEEVGVAKALYQEAVLKLERRQALLENASLVSPADGIVMKLVTQEGEYVGAGDGVVVLGDFSYLVVDAYANDIDLVGVSVGDRALVRFIAQPELELGATIISIMPNDFDSARGSFLVKLALDAPVNRQYWGMSVEVFFEQ